MPGRDSTLKASRVIVTEGVDDQRFFEAFVAHLHLNDLQVLPIGGKTRLTENLSGLVSQAGFAGVVSVLIVRDADDNPRGAFDSVCASLGKNDLPHPSRSWEWVEGNNPKGDPAHPSKLRVAVLILPGAEESGALEEVVLRTVETDVMLAPARELVAQAVSKLPAQTDPPTQRRAHPPSHRRGKATIHAFLATFEEPDKRFGEASQAGYWDFAHVALNPIVDMLKAM